MSKSYNVFLSWSGERSRLTAEFLRGWLSTVVQAAKPWMSEAEIDKGSRSLGEIAKALADIKVGIVCLTPENLQRPWIFFEAGALSKSIDDRTRLCTYLIGGLESSDIAPPLGMFQGTESTKEETLKLVQTINRVVSDDPISEAGLNDVFEAMWPRLESRLASLPPPEDSLPPKRTTDDKMAEILEIVRTQASQKEKTRFMDEYIPLFQQLLPALQQALFNASRVSGAGTSGFSPGARLAYPTDTSLQRKPGSITILNTFGFPKDLQKAMPPLDSQISGRRLDLVQMFGQTFSGPEGRSATIRFTVKGVELPSSNEASYDIDFVLEIDTARKIASYLEQIASQAERM